MNRPPLAPSAKKNQDLAELATPKKAQPKQGAQPKIVIKKVRNSTASSTLAKSASAPDLAAPGTPATAATSLASSKKMKMGTQQKGQASPDKRRKSAKDEEEPEYGPDNPPPPDPVPPAPLKRKCSKCQHLYLMTELQPYGVLRDSDFFSKITLTFKEEEWFQSMNKRHATDRSMLRIRAADSNKKISVKNFEFFCDLCYNQVLQGVEYRFLQHQNHQLFRINRSYSQGSFDYNQFHKPDKFKMGQMFHEQPRTHSQSNRNRVYMDPLIKKHTFAAKLVRWRLFLFYEKFVEFDRNFILSMISLADAKVSNAERIQAELQEKEAEFEKRREERAQKRLNPLKNVKKLSKAQTFQMQQREKELARRKASIKYSVFLQVKFGQQEPESYMKKNHLKKVDPHQIQRIEILRAGGIIPTKEEAISGYLDAEKTIPKDSAPILEAERDISIKDPMQEKDIRAQTTVLRILGFHTFDLFSNEKSLQIGEKQKGSMGPQTKEFKGPKTMHFQTGSLARNVELFELPLKAIEQSNFYMRKFQKPGTCLNRHKSVVEKREEFMRTFFQTFPIEFRLTIGQDWENYFAKSEAGPLLRDLTQHVQFERNSQVNKFLNVVLYTNTLKRFNLKLNLGVAMDQEMSEAESENLLPELRQVDSFQNFYFRAHNYFNGGGYQEILLDKTSFPEGLPSEWFKLARRGLFNKAMTQYEDPTIYKKTVKKYGKDGKLTFITQLVNTVTNDVLHEHNHGQRQPTPNEITRVQIPMKKEDDYLSVTRKAVLASKSVGHSSPTSEEKKKEETGLNLDMKPKPSLSQKLMRRELDRIRDKVDELEAKKFQTEMVPEQEEAMRRLMNNQSSSVQMRGYQKVESKKEIDPLTKAFGKKAFEDGKIMDPETPSKSGAESAGPSSSEAASAGSSYQRRKKKKKTKEELDAQRARQVQHQRVFLKRQQSIKSVIHRAKMEVAFKKNVEELPKVVQSLEPDMKVVEDEIYLAEKLEKEQNMIQEHYKSLVDVEPQFDLDNKLKDRLKFRKKMKSQIKMKQEEMDKKRFISRIDPEKEYERDMQHIYKTNIENLIRKNVDMAQNSDIQKQLFPITRENKLIKISEKDIEVLERYEKLLFSQNEKLLLKLKSGGSTMLRPRERQELNELITIKKKKHHLIERLKAQKEEYKFKELEERINGEVERGIRRGRVLPNV